MPFYTKNIHPSKGSYLLLLPKKWVEKFGNVNTVLIEETENQLTIKPLFPYGATHRPNIEDLPIGEKEHVNCKCVFKPIPTSLTANKRALSEVSE
jgi:hypothetical protein